MSHRSLSGLLAALWLLLGAAHVGLAQAPKPYEVFPSAEPPYYRVRYPASTEAGQLPFAVNYTIWTPPEVKTLRGVIVHQHGCGEGSCKSGLTGAYDLHWQALARKHRCALLSPAYEQPEGADCQLWCDPRNGSDTAFQRGLAELGQLSGHPELAQVPWALWGHSGGGHWAGGMVLLHPDRVAAAWLRSGVPQLTANPQRSSIKAHTLTDQALQVPLMCNLGTKEGYSDKEGRFAGVWPSNQQFFQAVRARGGLVGISIDPLTAHECGNQRYLAIPWFDACLQVRLSETPDGGLRPLPRNQAWLADLETSKIAATDQFTGDVAQSLWLPNGEVAAKWQQYQADTAIADLTPPPTPTQVTIRQNTLTWTAVADLESGLSQFQIDRDGQIVGTVTGAGKNPFGRQVFQNLQYSDTPTQPLAEMKWIDAAMVPGDSHVYRVIAVNTMGLKSAPSQPGERAQP